MEGGSVPENGFLLEFDGPAAEERVSMCVPPEERRWFCESMQMGTEETVNWWVTAEEPPADESISITEYRPAADAEPEENEDGDLVIQFTCDDARWAKPVPETGLDMSAAIRDALNASPDMAAKLAELGISGPGIPRSVTRAVFSAKDVRAILVGGVWIETAEGCWVREVVMESNPDDPVKVGLGLSLCFEEAGRTVAIPPADVSAFRFAESTVVGDEIQTDPEVGSVRVSRARYEAGGTDLGKAMAAADFAEIIEPDGTQTIAKTPEQEADA